LERRSGEGDEGEDEEEAEVGSPSPKAAYINLLRFSRTHSSSQGRDLPLETAWQGRLADLRPQGQWESTGTRQGKRSGSQGEPPWHLRWQAWPQGSVLPHCWEQVAAEDSQWPGGWHTRRQWWTPQGSSRPQGRPQETVFWEQSTRGTGMWRWQGQGRVTSTVQGGQATLSGWQWWGGARWPQGRCLVQGYGHTGSFVPQRTGAGTTVRPHAHTRSTLDDSRHTGQGPAWHRAWHVCRPQDRVRPHSRVHTWAGSMAPVSTGEAGLRAPWRISRARCRSRRRAACSKGQHRAPHTWRRQLSRAMHRWWHTGRYPVWASRHATAYSSRPHRHARSTSP